MVDVHIRSGRALLGLVAVVALMASTVTIVVADSFNDVPDGSFFEPSIDAITDAGCASGYNDGTFKPKENPSRGQFALWAANCLSRSGSATGPNVSGLSTDWQQIDRVEINVAGFEDGTQYLNVGGWLSLNEAGTECPCDIQLKLLLRAAPNLNGPATAETTPVVVSVQQGSGGDIDDSISGTWQIAVNAGKFYAVETHARVFSASSSCIGNCLDAEDSELVVWTSALDKYAGIGVGAAPESGDVDAELTPSGNPNG